MHSYLVALRVSGKTLNPSSITRELGIEPTQIRIAGQPRPGGKSVWEESMWEYEAGPPAAEREWHSLKEGLVAILSKFSHCVEKLRDCHRVYKVQLFCSHFSQDFNGGPTLPPALLKLLGDFGIELFLDTYSSYQQSN